VVERAEPVKGKPEKRQEKWKETERQTRGVEKRGKK